MSEASWHRIPVLNDNYIWLVIDSESQRVIAVDPTLPEAVIDFLEKRSITLTDILITHHHHDHIGGVKGLLSRYPAKVYGSKKDKRRLPQLDFELTEGDKVTIGSLNFNVSEIDGHTVGHILYHEATQRWAFVGDTLFSLGCGRMFEGSAEEFTLSLNKIKKLAPETLIFCAHEYTLANARFAVSVDPTNKTLESRISKIKKMREQNVPTIPFLLKDDLETNPFLRLKSRAIKDYIQIDTENEEEVFGKLRSAKDNF
jgi:hydroxyacylglutathione hydrolase